jgi:hypothetical protein
MRRGAQGLLHATRGGLRGPSELRGLPLGSVPPGALVDAAAAEVQAGA